jgi:hypothetical protein
MVFTIFSCFLWGKFYIQLMLASMKHFMILKILFKTVFRKVCVGFQIAASDS